MSTRAPRYTAMIAAMAGLLIAPGVAQARKPIISYLDANGKFQLYDAETGTDAVAPPVPVPAGAANKFKWGMSLDGRYIVFTDANVKLHLLDRLDDQQVPLPGIDLVGDPANLTVSDTGLIGFDNNSNKPTYVYDSKTKKLVDTGLDADPNNPNNEHRQPRFSGDGNFMATTCFDNAMTQCFSTNDSDSDAFLQNLATKQQVPNFPDQPANNGKDEEHPCINGDGTLIAVERPNPAQKDIFLYQRNGNAFSAVATPGLNDAANDDRFCELNSDGAYISDVQNNVFKLYERSSGSFVPLAGGRPFDFRSTLSAPYVRPASDRFAVVQSLEITAKRFRVGSERTAMNADSARKRRPRGTSLVYSVSAPVKVQIRIFVQKVGRSVNGTCRRPKRTLRKAKRCVRSLFRGLFRRNAVPGTNRTPFSGRIGSKPLRPGRYVAQVSASNSKQAKFEIVRK